MRKHGKLSSMGFCPNVAAVVLAAVALGALASAALAQNNPKVIPPQARYLGLTYGEWGGEWAKWWESIPLANHPGKPTGNVLQNQSGRVWFLNALGASQTVPRSITIPPGTALFFPMVNVFASDTHTGWYYGANESAQRAIVSYFVNHATDLSCEIDGRALVDLARYRADSPQVTIIAPPDHRRGLPAGTVIHGVIEGYWVLVTPLSVGEHTLHIHGAFDFVGVPGYNFKATFDQVYNITVVP